MTNALKYAQVAFPIPARQLFSYRLPEGLKDSPVGKRCLAPFGKRGNEEGVIVEVSAQSPFTEGKIKPLSAILDEEPLFSKTMLDFTRWTADYYAASWGQVLRCALPPKLKGATQKKMITLTPMGAQALAKDKFRSPAQKILLNKLSDGPASEGAVAKGAQGKRALAALLKKSFIEVEVISKKRVEAKYQLSIEPIAEPGEKLPGRQAKMMALLIKRGAPMLASEFQGIVTSPYEVASALAKKALVKTYQTRVYRDPFWNKAPLPPHKFKLTTGQASTYREIRPAVVDGSFQTFVMHGVTGSGKTEVYLRLIRDCLERGRRALYLVPEIGLTPMAMQRLRGHFEARLAVLHSGLSSGERYDEWDRIRCGTVDVVVGTRSAIFAPLENIGLIVVDEEHDASYKQEEVPYYHARDMALVLARRHGAPVILGSATPSTETIHNARPSTDDAKEAPRYTLLSLPRRVEDRPMPEIQIVDMAEAFRERGEGGPFSKELLTGLEARFKKGEQAMLLLNRRGFAPYILCRACGHKPVCEDCSVSLTLHAPHAPRREDERLPRRGHLMCHYCGKKYPLRPRCPECESDFIQTVGWGTEQAETELRRLFPKARLLRLDRDTASRKDSHHRILDAFRRNEADLLIGTQMIAKGHDFPNVTLAAVLSADTGLTVPDFRAAERTFQLLTQISGRAGRGQKGGEVIVQTHHPKHYAVEMACENNIEAFWDKELWFRKVMKYPPYTAMAIVLSRDADEEKAQKRAARMAEAFHEQRAERVQILGPSPAPLSRLKGIYRFHVLLKSSSRGRVKALLEKTFENTDRLPREGLRINIDPVNVL